MHGQKNARSQPITGFLAFSHMMTPFLNGGKLRRTRASAVFFEKIADAMVVQIFNEIL